MCSCDNLNEWSIILNWERRRNSLIYGLCIYLRSLNIFTRMHSSSPHGNISAYLPPSNIFVLMSSFIHVNCADWTPTFVRVFNAIRISAGTMSSLIDTHALISERKRPPRPSQQVGHTDEQHIYINMAYGMHIAYAQRPVVATKCRALKCGRFSPKPNNKDCFMYISLWSIGESMATQWSATVHHRRSRRTVRAS